MHYQLSPLHRARLVTVLFFLSGMTGLAYEVIWFKQFSHVWGSSTLSMAAVVSAFLLGLGVGGAVAARFVDRITRPLAWYGMCELGIGLLAMLIPVETDLLWRFSVENYSSLNEYPLWHALLRCALTFAVLGPPSMLMGSTLPLLVRQFSGSDAPGPTPGWLYGVNALGSAVGCYLVGFHLLPGIGLSNCNFAAVATTSTIAIVALLLARGQRRQFDAMSVRPAENQLPPSGLGEPGAPGLPLQAVYVVALASGCASLMLQAVWNRHLALVLGSSTYAFSAMLLVFLAGIGVGGLFSRFIISNSVHKPAVLMHTIALLVATTVLGEVLLPGVADTIGMVMPLRRSASTNAFVCIAGSVIVEFGPAVAMGILFSCLMEFARQDAATVASVIGRVYALNTLGSVVGLLAASLFLIPEKGTHFLIAESLILYTAVAVLVALLAGRRGRWLYVSLAMTVIAVVVHLNRVDDPRPINAGKYLYGFTDADDSLGDILFFKEGPATNVLVTKKVDSVSFRVNGKVDGSSRGDMSMQLGLAYVPRFLNPGASNILVVGFGTGTTSGASLLFPDARVTCCEIEPAVFSASGFFSDVNHSPHESPRFHLIIDDARACIQGSRDKYDLILSEPSNPWIAGVSNLFTAEFYSMASQRLAPGGILAQWIQTYSFTSADYAMIVRTMRDVFPHLRLVRISESDTILLGSNDSLQRGPESVWYAQRTVDALQSVKRDLNQYFGTTDVSGLLLRLIVLDEQAIDDLITADGSLRRNRDTDLQLEFRAASHLYDSRDGAQSPDQAILSAARAAWFRAQCDQLECDERHANTLHTIAMSYFGLLRKDAALAVVDHGLAICPQSPELMADRLILLDQVDLDLLERLLAQREEVGFAQINRVAKSFWEEKRFDDAIVVYQRLCETCPTSATSWTNLAINLECVQKWQESGRAHARAAEVDPANAFAIRSKNEFMERQRP